MGRKLYMERTVNLGPWMGFRATEIVYKNLSKCELFWGFITFPKMPKPRKINKGPLLPTAAYRSLHRVSSVDLGLHIVLMSICPEFLVLLEWSMSPSGTVDFQQEKLRKLESSISTSVILRTVMVLLLNHIRKHDKVTSVSLLWHSGYLFSL